MSRGLRDYKLALDAGIPQTLNVQGDYYHVLVATSDVTIKFDEGAALTRSVGQGGEQDYSRVTIVSTVNQSVVVSLGYGSLSDSRSNVSATINTTIAPSNKLNPKAEIVIGAGATVLLAAANANRKELRIGVKSTEANGVYIGDISAGAATPGGYIEEGSVEYVNCEAAVYGYNAGAGAITVNVLDLERL